MATVADMIAMLQQLPQDLEVYLSADAEGNSFKKAQPDAGTFFIEKSSAGAYEVEDIYNEDDVDTDDLDDYTNIVIIWP
jgi:hypothetical protein